MDISFTLNILISVTGWVLALRLWKNEVRNHFIGFFVVTGLSSFIAAFGHSDMYREEVLANLLLVSRIFSIWSLYYFARGTMRLFNLYTFKPARALNALIPILLLSILMLNNSFLPVMLYGIMTLAILGSIVYSLNVKQLPKVSIPMITGIAITTCAALVFGFLSDWGIFKPVDISHMLMAIALPFMARGVNNISLYEIES